MRKLELLAPAKNLEYGRSAIDFGADAVYIAAGRFGARYAAGNSMEDIAKLTTYAHTFGAKVYLTINTLLLDDELADARQTICEAWEAGVDALIVQDMAILEMDIPPIEIHASTQTLNIDPAKARFFEQAGMSRVILERALSLEQISAIRGQTSIELEAFVHGAICVCYSGGCYMSHAVAGRSGNRGVCSQPCRSAYNLTDSEGREILNGKHLLSVGDLDLSARLSDLAAAGVDSFKIEGRLKDLVYLKNTVAHYRSALDAVIAGSGGLYTRSSDGTSTPDFTPDPARSFTRGFTEYYIDGKRSGVSTFNTPKSTGDYLGRVDSVGREMFTMDSEQPLAGGDGICFFTPDGTLVGTNINTVDGRRIYPNRMDDISTGTEIYRNYDHRFSMEVERSRANRRIDAEISMNFTPLGATLSASDSSGATFAMFAEGPWDEARKPETAVENVTRQLSKGGDSIFRITSVRVSGIVPFVGAAELNAMRRELLEGLTSQRLATYKRRERRPEAAAADYPTPTLDFKGNVLNALAESFYRRHGVSEIEKGFELQSDFIGREVMRTKYCIRRELGKCSREPLFIENYGNVFELGFDCKNCEMTVIPVKLKAPKSQL